jgi:hypothetical protein
MWHVALVIGLVVAVVDFPRALEPGRSEHSGVVLNTLVDQGHGLAANDWYNAAPDAEITADVTRIRVAAGRPGYQLVSRQIPVYTHQCYVVLAHANVSGGHAEFDIFDGEVRSVVAGSSVPIIAADDESAHSHPEASVLSVAFDTGALRRITLGLVSAYPAVIQLSSVSVTPASSGDCRVH